MLEYIVKYSDLNIREVSVIQRELELFGPIKINENLLEEITKKYESANKAFLLENYDNVITYIRLATEYHLTQAFSAMMIDTETDVNTMKDTSVGNIGTPGRIAKLWVGKNSSDDSELFSGRFMKEPRMASFAETEETRSNTPITKRFALTSNCSHHGLAFSTSFRADSYAVVSYIPNGYKIGISKLQRIANYIAKRGWLQEDLTKALHDKIAEVSNSTSVMVKLVNVVHSCESLRGAHSTDSGFTTECFSGDFDDPTIREYITNGVK